jgi:hypothetical protein
MAKKSFDEQQRELDDLTNALQDLTKEGKSFGDVLQTEVLKASRALSKELQVQNQLIIKINEGEDKVRQSVASREKIEKQTNRVLQLQRIAQREQVKLNKINASEIQIQAESAVVAAQATEDQAREVAAQIPLYTKLISSNKTLNSIFGQNVTLQDMLVAGGLALIAGLNKVQKSQKEFRSTTGQNVQAFADLNDRLVTAAEQIQSAAELSKQLGVNAQVVFSSATIMEVAELTNNLGIAAEEAGNLAAQAKLSGTNLNDNAENIVDLTKGFIRTNKIGINFRGVLDDVSTASSALTISLGGSTEELAKASLNAKKLGINLKQAEAIAESLLDFESSIEAELEAELLTGRNLNFEKARLAALNNDIATLTEEIAKNEGISEAFASGNRIQQDAIAKSIGMSREDMAQMILQQRIQSGLSVEQAALASDISLEEAKRLTTQDQIAKSLDKISQAFAPILNLVAAAADNTFALYSTLTLIAGLSLAKTIGQLASVALLSNVSNPLALVGAIAGTAILAGIIASSVKKTQNINDGIVGPQGGLMLSGPKGSVSLDSADTVVANKNGAVAGTDLLGSGGLVQEMRQMKAIMTQLLNKNVDVYLDSDKVGTSLNVRTVNIQ